MTSHKFFDFTSDNYGSTPHDRWQIGIRPTLDSGEWWDVWAYSRGEPASPPPYPFTISAAGPRSEINLTWHQMCVVSTRIAEAIVETAERDIQLIPVSIAGDSDEWCLVNPLWIIDCLDHERSIITNYYPDDFEQPAKAGTPRGILRLVIDPERVGNHDLFRVKDWTMAIIVSDRLRLALEETWALGLRFEQVTP